MHIGVTYFGVFWGSFLVNIYASFYLGKIKECGSTQYTEGAWFFGRALNFWWIPPRVPVMDTTSTQVSSPLVMEPSSH